MTKLAPRQEQVLQLHMKGYSYEQIAKELKMSVRTIKNHTRTLFRIFQIPYGSNEPRILLVVAATYKLFPHLRPFSDGDRAAQCGLMSAKDYIDFAESIDSENHRRRHNSDSYRNPGRQTTSRNSSMVKPASKKRVTYNSDSLGL